MSQTSSASEQRSPLEALLPHWQTIAYALIAAGAAMAIIPLFNIFVDKFTNPPLCVWAGSVALTLVIAGAVYLSLPRGRTGSAMSDLDHLRLLILAVLGVCGFFTAVFGLILPFVQYRPQLAGGLEAWRKNALLLTWCIAAFMGGLVLMFIGLAMGRTYERTQAGLRRLMYGYNAVLTSLLLLLILAIVNVLCYSPVYPFSKARAAVDWTSSGMYTLQPATKSLVAGIDQPVKVYVLMPSNLAISDQLITLLQNCRDANERISWESVSPQLNREQYNELATKYLLQENGLLVLYGAEPNVQFEAIPISDLYKVDRDKIQFTGEGALYKALTILSEGKARPKVYFTQGNGELDYNDRSGHEIDQGLGVLIEQLGKGNYELQPLLFDGPALAGKKGIPEDADVVVLVGPRKQLADQALEALRTYMRTTHGPDKKKGKLIVMLDVMKRNDGSMVQTGLEPLLREFGVQVGNNEVLDAGQMKQPNYIQVVLNRRNPVGRAFASGNTLTGFLFIDARTVSPLQTGPGSDFRADVLAEPYGRYVWAEEDLNLAATPQRYLHSLIEEKGQETLNKKLSGPPISLAVTVTEAKMDPMLPPGHPGTAKDQTPRLVVFGDAAWVCNEIMDGTNFTKRNTDLMTSCLSWLRERPNLGSTPTGKERSEYSLEVSDQEATRLEWLPGVLMLIGVATLGGGVWVVRRR